MSGKNPVQQGYQQSAASAKSQDDHMQKVRDKNSVRFGPVAGQGGVREFPGYYQSQEDDTTMGYRAIAGGAEPQSVNDAVGHLESGDLEGIQRRSVDLTPADIQWYEKRRMEREKLEFDDWARTNLDLSNPNTARWFQSIYPEYMQRRERWIDDQHNVSARAAKIRLRGIKDKEDLYFLWAVQSGRITLPATAIWNPGTSNDKNAQFQRGIFNPRQYTQSTVTNRAQGGLHNDWFEGGTRVDIDSRPNAGVRGPVGGQVQQQQGGA